MLTLHMLDDGRVKLVQPEQNGLPQKVKFLVLNDVIEAFRDQASASPILPLGTIQYWQGYHTSTIALYTEAHRRKMTLDHNEYDLPIPAMISVFQIGTESSELSLHEAALFTCKGPFVGGETMLYQFPYGNVFNNNRVCWGEVDFPLHHFFQAGSLVDQFLGSNFNYDLSGHYNLKEIDGEEEDLDLDSFWELMSKSKSFPEDRLVELGPYKNLQAHIDFFQLGGQSEENENDDIPF